MKKTVLYSSFGILMLACSANENTSGENSAPDNQPSISQVNQDESVVIAKDVTAEEFHEMISSNASQLIDVRTAGEYNGGTIEGAQNIDYYASDFKSQIAELDKSKPVYVFCRSGSRSAKAVQIFKEAGFTEIYNLIGGYSGWNY